MLSTHRQSTYAFDVSDVGTGVPRVMLAIEPSSGDVIAAGPATSASLPMTGAAQPVPPGEGDIELARFSPDLTRLHGASFLGGSQSWEELWGLAITRAGDRLYVAGTTTSTDMPGTAGAAIENTGGPGWDAFVSIFDPSLGEIERTTYFSSGGVLDVTGFGLALDASTGDVYLSGFCGEPVPETTGGFQEQFADTFVALFDADLSGGADAEPDPFAFASHTGVPLASSIASAPAASRRASGTRARPWQRLPRRRYSRSVRRALPSPRRLSPESMRFRTRYRSRIASPCRL
jgi:hypothetical protein